MAQASQGRPRPSRISRSRARPGPRRRRWPGFRRCVRTWSSWIAAAGRRRGSVCREIRSRMPEVACLMLTSFGDDEALFDAIMAGRRVCAQADPRHRSGRRGAYRRLRPVDAGPAGGQPADARLGTRRPGASRWPAAAQERRPGADRRGADQPADRRADVPGREDGEELRLRAVRQAGHGAPDAGRRLRRPCLCRRPRQRRRISPGVRTVPAIRDPMLWRDHPDPVQGCGSAARSTARPGSR